MQTRRQFLKTTALAGLAAGLDTFAYRNPHRRLRVFEVDHPSTQAWKRNRLKEQSIDVPRSLTFAPVDFETQTLAGGLKAAGFRADGFRLYGSGQMMSAQV